MRYFKIFILVLFLSLGKSSFLFAQQNDSLRKVMSRTTLFPVKKDSAVLKQDSLHEKQKATLVKNGADTIAQNALKPAKDTFFLFRKKHTPKGATVRSMILPGWGQAYNHEYWKVPLAVAAVGIPVYLYFTNTVEYHKAQTAYHLVFQSLPGGQYPGATGTPVDLSKLDKKFQDYYNQEMAYYNGSDQGKIQFLSGIQSYRNSFRQYRDYSILFAFLLWGLQVADATVFGHLREFDVSPDLSMKISPTYFQYAKVPGITLNFNLKYRN